MSPYQEQTIRLSSGDILIFYTDGVTEAKNEDETEEFGEERLYECIKNNRGRSASEIKEAIKNEVLEFSGGVQHDDITLIVVRVN